MVMKCTVVSFVALAVLSSFCDAQRRDDVYRPSLPKYPRPVPRGKPVPRTPVPIGLQQSKQTFEQPLTWRYPEDPKPDVKPPGPFELRRPVAAISVAVACTETEAHVEVMRDFFGIGQLIDPADLTLGECGVTAVDTAAQVLIFTVQLQDCGSLLAMTEDTLIYTFSLNYNPQPMGAAPLVRTNQAAVIVECHYQRKQNVSSLPLDPLWVPFSAVKVAEEFLYFTLKLMTDDWQSERSSYQYFLGDTINIQAVVKQYFHVPLRIYVDSCVAAPTPDATSTLRYTFIDNNGCFIDAKITGSKSKFLVRTVDNMLQFQMEAFRFQDDNAGMVYITCHLTATSAADHVDSEHRSCSYNSGIWKEASGADAACSSCDSGVVGQSGGSGSSGVSAYPDASFPGSFVIGVSGGGSGTKNPYRKPRDVFQREIFEWQGDVTLGPFHIEEKV